MTRPFESAPLYKLTCVLLFGWWLAYFYPFLSLDSISLGLAQAGEATEQGSLYNQLLVVSFAALGVLHLPYASGFLRTRRGQALAALLGLYCLWSALSVFWSEDAALTIRRLAAGALLLIGSIGLGAGFYARTRDGVLTLARHVLAGAAVAIVLLVVFRLSADSIPELLDPRWSLKDSTRISYWTFPAGYAALASLVLFKGKVLRRWTAVAVCCAALVLLKGRGMIGDVAASALIVYSRITPRKLLRPALLSLGCLLSAVLADLATGGNLLLAYFSSAYDGLADWIPYLSIGDGAKNITSLSGRLPLWRALYTYIADRPWRGYGFGAFWDTGRFDEIYALAGWRAVAAHNGFLDELLATGAVGMILFLAFWLYGMALAVRHAHRSPASAQSAWLVFGWLLLFLMFNSLESIFQSFFQFPTYASLIGLFALVNARRDQWAPPLLYREFMVRERVR
jgi:O-antigen ligase